MMSLIVRSLLLTSALIGFALAITACGQKGDLYLPDVAFDFACRSSLQYEDLKLCRRSTIAIIGWLPKTYRWQTLQQVSGLPVTSIHALQ